MRGIVELPFPRTAEGAQRLGRAINAQFRAERWGTRRRSTLLMAAALGLALAGDNTLRFLPEGARRVVLAAWWTALVAAILSALVEVWSTARMQRALEAAKDA